MPEGLSFVEAATLNCAGVTAWARMRFSDYLGNKSWLVSGFSLREQGVWVYLLSNLPRWLGRVIATTGSADKVQLLGALELIVLSIIARHHGGVGWLKISRAGRMLRLVVRGVENCLFCWIHGPSSIRLVGSGLVVGSRCKRCVGRLVGTHVSPSC